MARASERAFGRITLKRRSPAATSKTSAAELPRFTAETASPLSETTISS